MDYLGVVETDEGVLLRQVRHFIPAHIFECGQCFRFQSGPEGYTILAHGKRLSVLPKGRDILLAPCTRLEFEQIWKRYFDLERDYSALCRALPRDEKLRTGMSFGKGLRILRQEPFETLISFVISANNNIARIKGIVERICRTYGTQVEENCFAFPGPEQLARASEEELRRLGCGYRAPYLVHSARAIAEGFSLEALRNLSYQEAKKKLQTLPGVGPKVADCVLLFSLDFSCAFPVDVWVQRAMERYLGYPVPRGEIQTYAAQMFGRNAGLAQQYLFFYAREKGRENSA